MAKKPTQKMLDSMARRSHAEKMIRANKSYAQTAALQSQLFSGPPLNKGQFHKLRVALALGIKNPSAMYHTKLTRAVSKRRRELGYAKYGMLGAVRGVPTGPRPSVQSPASEIAPVLERTLVTLAHVMRNNDVKKVTIDLTNGKPSVRIEKVVLRAVESTLQM